LLRKLIELASLVFFLNRNGDGWNDADDDDDVSLMLMGSACMVE
jgi:hypothetical protein